MNTILVDNRDLVGINRARLTGRRAEHIRTVLRAAPGDELRVGVIGGAMGKGIVASMADDAVELEFEASLPPPAAARVTLALALPRPKCLRRIFQCAAAMGIKRIALFGAYRVEKSYWDSPWLIESSIHEQLILGLEQAGDTVLPVVSQHPLFKPFVEDTLPDLCRGMDCLLAVPAPDADCPAGTAKPACLTIGPEGGFTEYEMDRLKDAGFRPVSLGPRPLRTEHAVAALLGRLT